ncbi:phosphotransferase [Gallaecimonas sp. GXIMD4217]|uniref:aminoglycoside phosphotransferase family protein n=1 Tax=Gallaecimonas sp. GXIMD4217 TaxID=3131927 RepID=UPI00311B2268
MTQTHFQALGSWIQGHLQLPTLAWQPLSGDAGGRSYFRLLNAPEPLLAVHCSNPAKELLDFDRLGLALAGAGVPVPRPLALDAERGFMLIPDYGDRLLSSLTADERLPWYRQAMGLLPKIRAVQAELPRADLAFVTRKRQLFEDWYLARHLGVTVPQTLLQPLFERLYDNFFSQPQVPSHRDYHGRNLLCHGDELVVIDFQDLLLAPLTYDAASLLRDSYVSLSTAEEQALIAQAFAEQAFTDDEALFKRWLDLTAMLRQLKILGIFCRLHYQDGKSRYLDSLAPTRDKLLETARRYPEFADFADWLEANA